MSGHDLLLSRRLISRSTLISVNNDIMSSSSLFLSEFSLWIKVRSVPGEGDLSRQSEGDAVHRLGRSHQAHVVDRELVEGDVVSERVCDSLET